MKILTKIAPGLLFWIIFIVVIFKVPYPESLTQANLIQAISFFTSFYLAIAFSLNIFLKNILLSFSISLGFIFLLILKALDSLNFVTAALILLAIALFISYFRKTKQSNLTKRTKIPKLTQLRK